MGASQWRLIGHLSDIPRSGARRVRVGEVEVGVFRTSNDQLFALEDVCPHLGGPLSEGIVHGNSVTCPLHNLVIDLESGQSVAPESQCVRSCMIRLEGDQIFLSDIGLRELASKQIS